MGHSQPSIKILFTLTVVLLGTINWISMKPGKSIKPAGPVPEVHKANSVTTKRDDKAVPIIDSTALAPPPSEPAKAIQQRIKAQYGRLPLSFEANRGQVDEAVKYLARGSGYDLFLTSTEAVLNLSGGQVREDLAVMTLLEKTHLRKTEPAVLRMKLLGAKPDAEVTGVGEQPGKSNYFLGNDRAKWRKNVTHYSRVRYADVYPGVDLIYYGNQRQLEYDFVISPGSSPDKIKLAFEGAKGIVLDTNGALVLHTSAGELRQYKPVIYQTVEGVRKEISGRYRINGKDEIGFEVEEYDQNRPLVIDPVLAYSSYLGGSGEDVGLGIAVDSTGNAYVTGFTTSINFPTVNSLSPGNDFRDVFITKVSASGTALVFSTYLGGNNFDRGQSIAVDASGNVYVTGRTTSPDFPKATPVQSAFGGNEDVFVTKLNANGSELIYSTFIGGTGPEDGRGIVVDSAGSIYVTGQTDSTNFPITANSFQPVFGGSRFGGDAFVTKLDPSGSAFVYSTFLGGNDFDEGNDIAIDASGNAYIAGVTHSPNFPTLHAFQSTINSFCSSPGAPIAPCFDAFVTKLNQSGSALVHSTFLGGSGRDEGHALVVDALGNVYVAGETGSTNFPTVNPFQAVPQGANDAFVAKFDAAVSAPIYSTYLGGSGSSEPFGGMAVDAEGNAYVTGQTIASDFPTVDPVQPIGGGGDAYVAKLNPAGSALVYSTYFGGSNYDQAYAIALDPVGNAYITGRTWGDFPTERPFQPLFGGAGTNEGDAFVAKIGNNAIQPPTVLSISAVTPNRGGNAGSVTVTVHGSGFATGATLRLVRAGQPDISAIAVGSATDSTIARARFDLSDQIPGRRDVVVVNPDNSSATLAEGFIVESGSQPRVWVDIIGRDQFRPGVPQTYYIAYGNRGNADSALVPIFIGMPKGTQYELGFNLITPPQLVPGQTFDFSQVPLHYETATERVLPLFIAYLPAGRSGFLKIRVTGGDEPLRLIARRPRRALLSALVVSGHRSAHTRPFGPHSTSEFDPNLRECLTTLASDGLFGCAIGFIPFGDLAVCAREAGELMVGHMATAAATAADIDNSTFDAQDAAFSLTQFGLGQLDFALTCAAREAGGPASDVLDCAFAAHNIYHDCDVFDGVVEVVKDVIGIFSRDPNAKSGSGGVGANRYLAGEEPLRYAVDFENVESATAPAQDVVITDQLDGAKLDFDTFSLGPIGFGKDKQVIPPAGLSEFKRDLDLRPEKDLIVRVEAKLEKSTGLLTWRFTSLDPATGLPTEDPTAGFLPPNHTAPEGEGQVLFTVQAKSDVATGTEIRNRARIVFDTNAPIDTPEWLNTIDNSKPSSHVQSLPVAVPRSFIVSWSGTDAGAGIDSYTVFVSEDGGTFVPWLNNTRTTSAVFTGSASKTYRFLSIARDAVGNEEGNKTNSEATTTVSVAPGNPTDDASFFVSQHYRDFLNRDPEPQGFTFWTNQIDSCGADAQCVEIKRINVSAAFFLSIEFQETGFLVYRFYKSAYGNLAGAPVPLKLNEFLPDTQQIGKGIVVGQTGWELQLENNKLAFALDFVSRARFTSGYPTPLTPSQFVDALFTNSGVTPSTADRNAAISEFGGAANTVDTAARARALRLVAENSILKQQETNKAFVLMQYFGYLRRNPNDAPEVGLNFDGYNFWLNKLNQFNGNFINAEMVKAFIISGEYRQRFGP